jgi:hypothetical protein
LVRLAYQPPASTTFISEQTSHRQPANSTFLSEQISTSHQPLAKRIGCLFVSSPAQPTHLNSSESAIEPARMEEDLQQVTHIHLLYTKNQHLQDLREGKVYIRKMFISHIDQLTCGLKVSKISFCSLLQR